MRKYIGKIHSDRARKIYRRKLTIRNKISGTAERPRLCASNSNKNLFIQVIDDVAGKTLFSVQTFGKNKAAEGNNKTEAVKVGKAVAEKLKEHKIETIVFDRNGQLYTGVIATLEDSIREHGIKF